MQNVAGAPRTEFYTFTAAESEAMRRTIKTRLGQQYTVSHLGHAATTLALLKTNPIPSDTSDTPVLVMPVPVNGRRFLSGKRANTQYGACQASAMVIFEDLRSWKVDDNDRPAVVAALERASRHVQASYEYWLNKDFLLALSVSKDNSIANFFGS